MMIDILCKNDGRQLRVKAGSNLLDLARKDYPDTVDPKTGKRYQVLAALVDHKLKELSFNVFFPHEVTFIGYNHPDGRRTYVRSLSFLLQHAVRDVFPGKVLVVEHSLPSGLYCELRDGAPGGDFSAPAYGAPAGSYTAPQGGGFAEIEEDGELPF